MKKPRDPSGIKRVRINVSIHPLALQEWDDACRRLGITRGELFDIMAGSIDSDATDLINKVPEGRA